MCSGKRWGVQTDLSRRTVVPEALPLPQPLQDVAQRMRDTIPHLADFHPNEANAIEYVRQRGDYLLPHVDDRCGPNAAVHASCSSYTECRRSSTWLIT